MQRKVKRKEAKWKQKQSKVPCTQERLNSATLYEDL